MFTNSITWPSVGKTAFWTTLVAFLAGFFYTAGCYLFMKIVA